MKNRESKKSDIRTGCALVIGVPLFIFALIVLMLVLDWIMAQDLTEGQRLAALWGYILVPIVVIGVPVWLLIGRERK